jgi:hypothetical protein
MTRWLPFRYAGGLSFVVVFVLAIGGAIFLPGGPRPVATEVPLPSEVQAYLDANADARVSRCRWPAHAVRGAIDAETVVAWVGDEVLIASIASAGGTSLRDGLGGPVAWVQWMNGECKVWRPSEVQVVGQVVDGRGQALPDQAVEGCGRRIVAAADGTFSVSLGPEALLWATPAPSGPRCALGVGGPSTPVDLSAATSLTVMVQSPS